MSGNPRLLKKITDKDIHEIWNLYSLGFTLSEIIEKTGLPKKTVEHVIPEQEIIRLRKQNFGMQQIARILHIHHTKVMAVCGKHDLTKPLKIRGRLRPPRVLLPQEKWKLGYLAGLVDGEGSVNVDPKKPQLKVANTDKKMMDWCLQNFGGHLQTIHPKRANRKIMYNWRVENTHDIFLVLDAIIPFLITKKAKSEETRDICIERIYQNIYDRIRAGIRSKTQLVKRKPSKW